MEEGGWNAGQVRGLRRWLSLTQRAFAEEIGVRQQTVSEWETGLYQPRGASTRLLDIVAERAGFYGGPEVGGQGSDEKTGSDSAPPETDADER